MTSRREPIRHTCPDIDSAIKICKQTLSEILSYQRDAHSSETDSVLIDRITLESWADAFSEVGEGRNCYLENLRDANSTLREWGNNLVSDLKNLDDEIGSLNNTIAELERKLSDCDDIIYDLRDQIREAGERE